MLFRKLLISTLAVAGVVHAQNDACSSDQKIQSQGDLDKISNCQTLKSLTIGPNIVSVNLPNLTEITESFICEGAAQLTTINLGSLRSIGKEFRLKGLTILSTLSCPQLTTVGSINWVTLPELKSFTFTRTVTKAGSVIISDTRLESLTGIDLQTVSIFQVNNCKSLKSVNIGLKNVSQQLDLEFNGKSLDIQFPNLIWCLNMTIRSATSVKLPKLVHVNGSMSFEENLFSSLECPSLQEVEQTLAIIGNTQLTKVNFPELTDVGGALKFANNTQLQVVDGFPKLKNIGGAIDFAGAFTNCSFPSLEDVMGGFHLETSNELDCAPFKAMEGKVIQGDEFTCKTKVANPESKDGSGSGSGNGTKNAAKRNAVGSIVGLSLAAVLVVAF